MECPKCRTKNPADSNICKKCGAELDLPTATKTIQSSFAYPQKTIAGKYKILAEIGRGGMGEVYRAEDTKLNRHVAIKLLPDVFASDPERMARFEREAKVLASLNHPNIAAIYGLEEAEGKNFLVMELVVGETLEQRLGKGALSVDESLDVCRQIAEGIEAAHGKGIIHRDLKPANVKVTADGRVKVLDFGIAKALLEEEAGLDLMDSPTLTAQMTQPGVILGTAPYMSPEQAKGKAVDKRTDIWAFGCLLYECLSGKRAFRRESVSETMASILKDEPDWKAVFGDIPAAILRLMKRCLRKDPRQRLQSIGDARIEIEDVGTASPSETIEKEKKYKAIPLMLTAIVSALLTAILFLFIGPKSKSTSFNLSKIPLQLPDGQLLLTPKGLTSQSLGQLPPLALSRDGKTIAYIAVTKNNVQQLFIWDLEQFEPRPIPGTENAELPFFSPDGTQLGFVAKIDIFSISLIDGLKRKICEVPIESTRGAAWNNDGTVIVGGHNMGLLRVDAEGGTPSPLTQPNSERGEQYHAWPHVLPDGKHVLFTAATLNSTNIAVLSLETGQWHIIERTDGANQPHYISSGHLVFFRDAGLSAMPFDLLKLKPVGSPVPVVEKVFMGWNAGLDLGLFSVSSNGHLIYIPGGINTMEKQIVKVDRQGRVKKLPIERGRYGYTPAISHDDKFLILSKSVRPSSDLYRYEIESGLSLPLTSIDANIFPVWSTDGKRVIFSLWKTGFDTFDIYWMPWDKSGKAESILIREEDQFPKSVSVSNNGTFLAFDETHPISKWDIHIVSLEKDHKTYRFLDTRFDERDPCFSPDGRYLAYCSNENGQEEIYVRAFDISGAETSVIPVSTDGGRWPRFSKKEDEIFYRDESAMMAVKIELKPKFKRLENPRVLFKGPFSEWYDVTSDGQHFIMMEEEKVELKTINVVLNWSEELKKKVPVKK